METEIVYSDLILGLILGTLLGLFLGRMQPTTKKESTDKIRLPKIGDIYVDSNWGEDWISIEVVRVNEKNPYIVQYKFLRIKGDLNYAYSLYDMNTFHQTSYVFLKNKNDDNGY